MQAIIGRVPKQFVVGLLMGALMTAYAWVGGNDYQEAQASTELYCEMAREGAWPERPELNCPAPAPELLPGERLVAM